MSKKLSGLLIVVIFVLVSGFYPVYAGIIFSDGFEGGVIAPFTNSGDVTHIWAIDLAGGSAHSGTHWVGVDDPSTVFDNGLVSPTISSSVLHNFELSFWQRYDLESTFDGGIVEISVDGGAFTQILQASFTLNPYNATISTFWSSPIAGLDAFSGTQSEYIESIVDLDSYLTGSSSFQLMFRRGSDTLVGGTGWFIDDITVTADTTGVPEPTTMLLLGLGLIGIAGMRRKMQR